VASSKRMFDSYAVPGLVTKLSAPTHPKQRSFKLTTGRTQTCILTRDCYDPVGIPTSL